MNLRSRLAVLFGLVALVASVLVGGFSYRTTSSELQATTDRFLEARASETGQAFRDLVTDLRDGSRSDGRPGPSRQDRFENGLPVADDDAIIQVTGANGVVLTSSVTLPSTANSEALRVLRPGRGSETVLRFDDITLDGESYRMVSRALPQGGVIQVARSTEEDEELRAALIRRFALISALVAAAAAGVGWLIATRVTAPLRRLTAVAGEVAETRDFTTEVGEEDRSDEIGTLATSFATMLDALEASRLQQHRLIHDAGHEMRTPLTSLRANVAMLERAGDLPEQDRAEILAAIRSELIELSELFDEMIDLATDQHDTEIAMQPVDLAWLVGDVAARWERRSGRPIEIDVTPSVVLGDPTMLERAVSNLVSNADKFSPPGAPVTIIAGDGSVRVRDRGPGIPVEDRERVFDRFYRSEVTRSMPGSGLGLSIVAQVVQRHGGVVWATEAEGGGAEVGFRLQLAPAGAVDVSEASETSSSSDATSPSPWSGSDASSPS